MYVDEKGKRKTKSYVVDTDEGVRTETSPEALAKLKPAFAVDGSVTAGNSSQTSDGAAFVMVMSEQMMNELGIEAHWQAGELCQCRCASTHHGHRTGSGCAQSIEAGGYELEDIELIELNEAFASQSLAVIRELDLNPDIVNINGGAIALRTSAGLHRRQTDHSITERYEAAE